MAFDRAAFLPKDPEIFGTLSALEILSIPTPPLPLGGARSFSTVVFQVGNSLV